MLSVLVGSVLGTVFSYFVLGPSLEACIFGFIVSTILFTAMTLMTGRK